MYQVCRFLDDDDGDNNYLPARIALVYKDSWVAAQVAIINLLPVNIAHANAVRRKDLLVRICTADVY